MTALELHRITAGYGAPGTDRPVIRDLSIDFGAGSVTAILGPNGVGKTTLLNVALGWHRPWGGTVRVSTPRGSDARHLPPGSAPRDTPQARRVELGSLSGAERGRLLSLVPQMDHVPFEYTILEYVLLGRAPYIGRGATPSGHDVDLALDALDRAGIAALADHGVLDTSAGERQLVLLARSLAQDPTVLLLDEPSAHLDLSNKRRLVTLLRSLASEGRAVVLTAHEPEFAAAVADEVVLVHNGTVLAAGRPDDVMTGEILTRAYDTPVSTHEAGNRRVFLW